MRSFRDIFIFILYLKPLVGTQCLVVNNHRKKTWRNASAVTTTFQRRRSCNHSHIFCQAAKNEKQFHDSNSEPNYEGGTYRRFAEYAWERMLQSGLVTEDTNAIPERLARNSCPAKGSYPEASTVNIELRYARRSNDTSPIRLARYALLETLAPVSSTTVDVKQDGRKRLFQSIPQAIQVLNFVLFPDTSLPLPVLGMDLVTLPGGKHLFAIDFQPIMPPDEENQPTALFPPQMEVFKDKLEALHQTHVLSQRDVLPWGGDLPPQAQRFFSPFALWTRVVDPPKNVENDRDSQSVIQREVFDAFCAYFDLYLEMMLAVDRTKLEPCGEVRQGHVDYVLYRRKNDPARPMLTRLYGEEYAESVIHDVLFEML